MMTYIFDTFTAINGFDVFVFLGAAAGKATLLVGLAALLCLIVRRFSAAQRHFIWSLALTASLLLPLFSFVKGWEIPVLTSARPIIQQAKVAEDPDETLDVADFDSQKQTGASTPARRTSDIVPHTENGAWGEPLLLPNFNKSRVRADGETVTSYWPRLVNLICVLWLFGAGLLFVRLGAGIISTKLLACRAREFVDPGLKTLFSSVLSELNLTGNVRLFGSEQTLMPVVCGIWRPVVILPAEAESWTEARSRVVLMHELTHIARRDCLTQMLAQLACIFYWFNPFIWLAARRLRVEREHACDDFVLRAGTRPSDYAHHLLEIARSITKKERPVFEYLSNTTIAMAHRSQLEERLHSILNPENKYQPVSHPVTLILTTMIGLLFLSLAFVHPTVPRAEGTESAASNFNFETENRTPENSFVDLFSKDGSAPQETIVDERVKTAATSRGLTETEKLPTQVNPQNTPLTKNEAPEIEPDERVVLTASETDVPAPDSPSEIGPSHNPFIKAEYERPAPETTKVQTRADDFIGEMASVGYTGLSIDELIKLKTAGVNAEYVKALRAAGLDKLTVRELTGLRSLGVTPKYIEDIRNAGYKEATIKEIINLRALNVTPEFIGRFRDAGYDTLSIRDLIALRAGNMTIDYLNTVNSMGFGKLPLKEVTNLKLIGITPEFIRLARSRLGNDLTLKQIVGLKNSGILKDKQ